MEKQVTLALTQHQINWWKQGGNFNLELFEKVLKEKEKKQHANRSPK